MHTKISDNSAKKIDNNTSYSRATLERWADRLGLELTTSDRDTRMEAANKNEPIPRWQLQDAKSPHRDSVHGYNTLAEVGQALWEYGINRDLQDANPQYS